jgi:hypothetical protein
LIAVGAPGRCRDGAQDFAEFPGNRKSGPCRFRSVVGGNEPDTMDAMVAITAAETSQLRALVRQGTSNSDIGKP